MTGGGLRIAFAGTPALAATVLGRILSVPAHDVNVVYTQPDRPAGRGRRLTPSPVKKLALQRSLAVEQPARAADMDPDGHLRHADVLLVVAYGLLLPVAILERPRLGAINVHLSLLPRWRGAAPIQRAIQAGDTETGITIMQMDAGLDTGPILLQESCPIGPDDTSGSLQDRLATQAGDCAVRALDLLAQGQLVPVPQDGARATQAGKIARTEAKIDWHDPARRISLNVRAFNPWPVCNTAVEGTEIRILAATPVDDTAGDIPPGTLCSVGPDGIDVATGAGLLRITQLQLPGRKPAAARDFCNGHHPWLHPGARATAS